MLLTYASLRPQIFPHPQNILELLSLPQTASTVNLLRVCYWALGEFGCQLACQFLKPRRPVRKASVTIVAPEKNSLAINVSPGQDKVGRA